jgi:hypothetical protein
MKTFKCHSDLEQLNCNDPAYPVVKELIELLIDDFTWDGHPYDSEQFGFLCLVQPGDTDRVLSDIDMPWCLKDIPWEGASMRHGYIYAVYLGTDDYGMGFLIPDAEWVNGDLRTVLEEITD